MIDEGDQKNEDVSVSSIEPTEISSSNYLASKIVGLNGLAELDKARDSADVFNGSLHVSELRSRVAQINKPNYLADLSSRIAQFSKPNYITDRVSRVAQLNKPTYISDLASRAALISKPSRLSEMTSRTAQINSVSSLKHLLSNSALIGSTLQALLDIDDSKLTEIAENFLDASDSVDSDPISKLTAYDSVLPDSSNPNSAQVEVEFALAGE